MTTLKSKSLFSHISFFLTFLYYGPSSPWNVLLPWHVCSSHLSNHSLYLWSWLTFLLPHPKTWFSWRLNPRTLVSPLLQACPQEGDPITQIKPSPLHRRCLISTSNLDFTHKGQSPNSSYLLGISTWRPCHYNKVKLKFTLQNHVLVGPGSWAAARTGKLGEVGYGRFQDARKTKRQVGR